mmetsp:Transcript_17548/g.55418  ORF Transcript_17548/g.55418 Transcript_17548/m.55418 type:complete len:222 (-) Transcript_17548:355-1020(-)
MLLLPFGRKVVCDHSREVLATQVAVRGDGENGELALDKGHDRNGRIHRAAIDECDVGRLVGWQVRLVDAIGESGSCAVVEQLQDVEADDLGRIEHRATLGVGEVSGYREYDIRHRSSLRSLCNALQRLQEHGVHTFGSQHDFLIAVLHREADVARDVNHPVCDLRYFRLYRIGVKLLADERLQASDGVRHVGCDLLTSTTVRVSGAVQGAVQPGGLKLCSV